VSDRLPVLLPGPRPHGATGAPRWQATRPDLLFNARVAAGLALCLALQAAAGQALAAAGKPGVVETLAKWTPLLLGGFVWNIVISAVAMAIGTALGFLLGIAQISPRGWLRSPSWLVTQFLRNAPWLVLLFFCMFLLPFRVQLFGVTIPVPDWMKAALGFALPVMAYVAEIVRGAIQSIPAAQWESAESLAFSRTQILWQIIIPQCLKRMLPGWMNLYAVVAMASTLASMVGVSDVMTVAREVLTAEQRQDLLLPMYGYVLAWFFAYCYPIARWTLRLERRWAVAA
jgi:polar amino acid transport system permease protein